MRKRKCEIEVAHFRAGKPTAQLCASLVLIAGSGNKTGGNGGKNDGLLVRYTRMSLVGFIYTWASMNFFGISLLGKQGSTCLLRGSLAYVFSGVVIWMQCFKSVCGKNVSSHRNFLYTVEE